MFGVFARLVVHRPACVAYRKHKETQLTPATQPHNHKLQDKLTLLRLRHLCSSLRSAFIVLYSHSDHFGKATVLRAIDEGAPLSCGTWSFAQTEIDNLEPPTLSTHTQGIMTSNTTMRRGPPMDSHIQRGGGRRRQTARTDRDGDLVMDGAPRTRDRVSKGRGRGGAIRDGVSPVRHRGNLNSSAFQREVLRHITNDPSIRGLKADTSAPRRTRETSPAHV